MNKYILEIEKEYGDSIWTDRGRVGNYIDLSFTEWIELYHLNDEIIHIISQDDGYVETKISIERLKKLLKLRAFR